MAPAVPLALPMEMLRSLVAQPLFLGPEVVEVVLDPDVGEVVAGPVVVGAMVVAVGAVVVGDDDELPQAVSRSPTPVRSSAADHLRPRTDSRVTVDPRGPFRLCWTRNADSSFVATDMLTRLPP